MEFPEPKFDENTLELIKDELSTKQLERSECFNTLMILLMFLIIRMFYILIHISIIYIQY